MVFSSIHRCMIIKVHSFCYTDEDGEMKVKRTWNKFSKEWRCARVYEKKSRNFIKLLTAEVLDAAHEPTQRKRPVSNLKLIILSRKSMIYCAV